uniref:Uncharacterized protein n=1 Tax=Leersia perrieri TaxID=77586 RepID=A0A0D9V4B2_9ORYZ
MAKTGNKRQGPVIGIDLGTAYSCVAVWQDGRVEIVTNVDGGRTTPSYVAFTDTEKLVGDAAKSQASRNPTNTVFGTKRLMGRRFSDSSVQTGLKLWPFDVAPSRGDRPMVAVSYKRKQKMLAAEEVASMLLSKMKAEAEAYLGSTVKNAVVTVPASFDVLQRRATKHACAIAGLNVVGFIHDPTAAAVAYGYGIHESADDKNVLVFDLGGGHKIDVSGNPRAMMRLMAACEEAKRTLSSASWAAIEIDCLHEAIDFYSTITRDQIDDLNMDLFSKCLDPIKKCLADAGMDRSSVENVILVGGSTRIPRVRRLVQDLFNGKELRQYIDPEEAEALGAAIARRSDNFLNLLLVDSTASSLGVEETGGAMAVIIPKNTSIPVWWTEKIISMLPHHNNGVLISVFEGERPRARDNTLLGELQLPSCHMGGNFRFKIHVSVCMGIDADSVLTVSAGARNKVNQMIIMEHSQLSKEEIERMAKEAKEYMAEEEEKKERIKAKNSLEEFLYKKHHAIEEEKRKVDNALSAIEEMIQQVHDDQVSSARDFEEALKKLMIE